MARRSKPAPPPCPNEAEHTEGPSGYVAKFEWAEEMAKTHEQQQCPGCGLWTIWVPRETAEKEESR